MKGNGKTEPNRERWLNVGLIPLQGVHDKTTQKFHTEHPDRGVYVQHLINAVHLLHSWRSNCVVLSGGYTQPAAPHLSEAQSALDILTEFHMIPQLPHGRILLDDVALDSAENLMFGFMAVRARFPKHRIGRVTILPAWGFKRRRLNFTLEALGVSDQCYICGGFDASLATDPEGALTGERNQVGKMIEESDPFLVGETWETKRRGRYRGANYPGRLGELGRLFPRSFTALSSLRSAGPSALGTAEFRAAFQAEVVAPR